MSLYGVWPTVSPRAAGASDPSGTSGTSSRTIPSAEIEDRIGDTASSQASAIPIVYAREPIALAMATASR